MLQFNNKYVSFKVIFKHFWFFDYFDFKQILFCLNKSFASQNNSINENESRNINYFEYLIVLFAMINGVIFSLSELLDISCTRKFLYISILFIWVANKSYFASTNPWCKTSPIMIKQILSLLKLIIWTKKNQEIRWC